MRAATTFFRHLEPLSLTRSDRRLIILAALLCGGSLVYLDVCDLESNALMETAKALPVRVAQFDLAVPSRDRIRCSKLGLYHTPPTDQVACRSVRSLYRASLMMNQPLLQLHEELARYRFLAILRIRGAWVRGSPGPDPHRPVRRDVADPESFVIAQHCWRPASHLLHPRAMPGGDLPLVESTCLPGAACSILRVDVVLECKLRSLPLVRCMRNFPLVCVHEAELLSQAVQLCWDFVCCGRRVRAVH